jgi:hypothetical protein
MEETSSLEVFRPKRTPLLQKSLGDNTHQALQILTSLLTKASLGACRSYLPIESFVIYACNCIVHLRIGFEWSYSCIRMVTLLYYPC